MDEEQIIVQGVELDTSIDVELPKQEVETLEMNAEITVDTPKEIEIDVTEETGVVVGTGVMSEHTHQVENINTPEGTLEDTLNILASPHEVYSTNGGIAEFRQWKTSGDVGRFVSLVYQDENDPITDGNIFIEVCNDSRDVYGVTVQDSAFCGYQNKDYCILGPSADNNKLLNCAKVCILGVARVRQGAGYHSTGRDAQVGDYVVPGDNGCAIYSENKIGFKVVAVGQLTGASDDRWNYKYVDIALVPQNDNVARIMAELEGTQQNLGNLSIQIGKLEDDINNSIKSVIPGINETLEDLNGAVSNTQSKLDAAADALDSAQKISGEAKDAIDLANTNYAKAVSDMEAAKTSANNALTGVSKIEEDMTILKQHEDKIVSFFDEANEDEASLAIMVKQTGDIAVIKAKTDQNGAALEHLVAHADRYCVGEHSLSYGLSYEEALGALGKTGKEERNGYIYVPTVKHDEKETVYSWGDEFITFEAGKAYVWMCDADGPNDTCHRWQESSIKVSLGDEPTTKANGDLWYTWNGVRVDNVWIYEPETLYRWTAYNETDGIWIAVARTNDGNARTMSFINQTAEKISSTITNLAGDVSDITQTVKDINLKVENFDSGMLSEINQTAENITLGVYKPGGGVSSLEIFLNGMRSVANYSDNVLVGEFGGSPKPEVKKYTVAPMWTKDGFSFAEATEATEEVYPIYYFDSDKTTYYCKQIDNDTYEVYTIGNQALANISTRVNDTESAITSLTQFDTEIGSRLTSVEEKSYANGAQISSIAAMQNVVCSEIKSELTNEEKKVFDGAAKYSNPPVWDVNDGEFKFIGNTSENGVYCITNDVTKYYKIIDTANGRGYEQYELSSIKLAGIEQKVDENGAAVEMVVQDGNIKGGVIAKAVNNQAEVLIEADKIGINGFTVFRDNIADGTTTISGNYIKTGVITSNNYSGPVTYRMYGAKIIDHMGFQLSDNPIYNFIPRSIIDLPDGDSYSETCDEYLVGGRKTIYSGGIGVDVEDCPIGDYYYVLNGVTYPITIISEEKEAYTLYKYEAQGPRQNEDYIMFSGLFDNGVDIYAEEEVVLYSTIEASDDLSDCIYYTPRVDGELHITDYYYANNIKAGEILSETNDNHNYIVSENDFELISSDINIEGTKFDLNVGTIYSKNLILDKKGNLTITGEITATGGYIGDGENGFKIRSTYISNGQDTYRGDVGANKTTGVYLGVDGIGLGNGNFYVDNSGDITLAGNINITGNINWGWMSQVDRDIENAQNNASTAISDVASLASGNYTESGYTFINGKSIYSPTIYANEFNVYTQDEDQSGSFNLYAYHTNQQKCMLKISYSSFMSPYIIFGSGDDISGVYADWDFALTNINSTSVNFKRGSTINFNNAQINGLDIPAKFG